MCEIMKEVLQKKLNSWEENYEKTGKSFDLVVEMNEVQTELILSCAFGEDATKLKLPYLENGKIQ